MIFTAVFTPDGKRVLTSSVDQTARLWDAATGKELRVFRGHAAPVSSARFSPNGRFVLTASEDGTTRLWDSETADELCRLVRLAGESWVVIAPDGTFAAGPSWNSVEQALAVPSSPCNFGQTSNGFFVAMDEDNKILKFPGSQFIGLGNAVLTPGETTTDIGMQTSSGGVITSSTFCTHSNFVPE